MSTDAGSHRIRAIPEAGGERGLPHSLRTVAAIAPLLPLLLAAGLGFRGSAALALVAGGGFGAALLFVLGPAPRWPAALLVGGSIVLAGIILVRAASWIDAAV